MPFVNRADSHFWDSFEHPGRCERTFSGDLKDGMPRCLSSGLVLMGRLRLGNAISHLLRALARSPFYQRYQFVNADVFKDIAAAPDPADLHAVDVVAIS